MQPATATTQDLRIALQNLTVVTAGVVSRLRRPAQRKEVVQALADANRVLDAEFTSPPPSTLVSAADAADEEARKQPGYRADLEG